jgi:hypothetical protein
VNDLGTFVAALRGDDTGLRTEAGPDALVRVAPALSSVLVVRADEDGEQTGTVAIVGAEGVGSAVVSFPVPTSFRVTAVGEDGGEFVLTAADGRTVHGTPNQFASMPVHLDEDVDPRRDPAFFAPHLRPHERIISLPAPAADAALSDAETVAAAGEAMVTPPDGQEVWLDFETEGRVTELLPQARALLADLPGIGRTGAEFLWSRTTEGDETEDDRAEFFEIMKPTSLVLSADGDFTVHYEGAAGTYCMDGYWLSVRFTEDRTPVDHAVEA